MHRILTSLMSSPCTLQSFAFDALHHKVPLSGFTNGNTFLQCFYITELNLDCLQAPNSQARGFPPWIPGLSLFCLQGSMNFGVADEPPKLQSSWLPWLYYTLHKKDFPPVAHTLQRSLSSSQCWTLLESHFKKMIISQQWREHFNNLVVTQGVTYVQLSAVLSKTFAQQTAMHM